MQGGDDKISGELKTYFQLRIYSHVFGIFTVTVDTHTLTFAHSYGGVGRDRLRSTGFEELTS